MAMLERVNKAHADRVRRVKVRFTAAELIAAGATMTLAKTFGKIPPNAVVLSVLLNRIADVTDGSTGAFDLDIGDGTTADSILDGGDIDGGTGKVHASTNVFVDGGTFTATVIGDVNLSTVTAGEFEAEVRFIA